MSKDKCTVCLNIFDSDETIERITQDKTIIDGVTFKSTFHCPYCGAEDPEDISYNPYDDDNSDNSILT